MFCPQCSQQQVSTEVRFCPRCGFQLDGVAQLLASGGALLAPAGPEEYEPASPRLKGVRQGMLLWLAALLVIPLLAILTEERIIPEAVLVLGAFLFLMGGFVRMVYALFFEDGPLRRRKRPRGWGVRPANAPTQLPEGWAQQQGRPDQSALPPGQSVPAAVYVAPRADTSELSQRPPSVTEGTTRLLDE